MKRDDDAWHRIELLTADPESILDTLWSAGALGIEVQDRDTYMEDGTIPPVADGMTRLIAFFAEDPKIEGLAERCQVVSSVPYDDRSWETAWKKYFRPVPVSARVVVGPPWEDFQAPPGGLRIEIEPGMAFGTGTHETTGLCAEILDELIADRTPTSVLDVGCGTGVLSMVAAGLGVEHVSGVDVDETAVEIARENLRRNSMTGQVTFSRTPLPRLGIFEVVVANILAHILIDLRDDLVARVAPGGLLVVSGVTDAQAAQFEGDFADPDMELVERRARGEWRAFVWRRR